MQEHARQIAEHGARLAGEAGFEVRPLWISDDHDIARAIVEGAAELDADLIVMGARGLTGIRALVGQRFAARRSRRTSPRLGDSRGRDE